LHAFRSRALGDLLADSGCCIDVPRLAALLALFVGRGRGKRFACPIVDDLRIDVPARTEDRQTWTAGRKLLDARAGADLAAREQVRRHFFLPSLRRIYSSA